MTKVIKPFPYSSNGYTVEHLVVGDERDFGAATKGLASEGYIESETVEPTTKNKKQK